MIDVLSPKLLILASAGSGKTYQLSNRIIGLVAKGADPERIVALTFTRKAAAEFADAVLNKLAQAATDPAAAERLQKELQLDEVDFSDVLHRVSRSLHRITLGTMDSFFARIVKAFQYELGLTGGRFELIEGPRQDMATDGILQHILGDVFGGSGGSEFSHAFRRASAGKEQQGVARNLRDYISRWHLRYRHHPDLEWGPAELVTHKPGDWEKRKQAMEALAQFGQKPVPQLIRSLQHVDTPRRLRAAQALTFIGPDAEDAVPALKKALDDPDERVRQSASQALVRIQARK